ncbi:MAG: S1C family serine protease [Rubrobacteraceae bacterium]
MRLQSMGARRFVLLLAVVLTVGAIVTVLLISNSSETGEAGAQTANQTANTSPSENTGDEPVARVASRVGPSAVQIDVLGGNGEGQGVGSGVIYREDGYIVTNNHVVEGGGEVEVLFADGSRETAEVVGGDGLTDLAVLRVGRNDLPAATFADSGGLVPGQMAVAIGSPQGLQSSVTAGVVSGLNREFPAQLSGGGQSALVDLVQTDAPISPGNSGGALANRDGEVIGINVAYLPPGAGAESLGFAIPSNTAISVADQLLESGEVSHPYLGVSLGDLSPEAAEEFGLEADSGAVIAEVVPNEPAAQAGLQAEDVVVAIDSEEVGSSGDLISALRDYAPGDTVTLAVLRDGEEIDLQVRLGERDE